jgi:hypothetical protein
MEGRSGPEIREMRRPDEESEPLAPPPAPPADTDREAEYVPRDEPDAVPAERSDKSPDPSQL